MLRAAKRYVWSSNAEKDSSYMRFWRLDEEPDEEVRRADVTIVSNGALSHWATVWSFEGGVVRVAELTAWPVEESGEPFEACNYLFYEISCLESLEKERGYSKHENPAIQVTTSPAELLRQCRDNPQNGTPYHAAHNNCQTWVVELLCNGYGVQPELLPQTWVEAASDLPERGSKAVLAGAAVGVLGRMGGGGLGLFLSLYDAKLAIDELLEGTPPDKACCVLGDRIKRLADLYEEEPDTAAREAVARVLDEQLERLKALREKAKSHHTSSNVTRFGGNIMGVASGACFLASPFTLGTSFFVGAGLAAGSTLTFGGGQVSSSYFGYDLRSSILEITDTIVAARKEYAAETGRLSAGLEGEPGVFEFSVPGTRWCQFYMTVQYTSADGTPHQRLSCDQSAPSWYGNRIVIEPGARDVQVSFDVRGGKQVYAVDRSDETLPWIKPYRREVFRYDVGDKVRVHFKLAGTSLHGYVYEVVEGFHATVDRPTGPVPSAEEAGDAAR